MKWTVLLQYTASEETFLWSGEAKTAANAAEIARRQAQDDNGDDDHTMDFTFLMAMPGDHWLIHHGDESGLPSKEPEMVDVAFADVVDAFNLKAGLTE